MARLQAATLGALQLQALALGRRAHQGRGFRAARQVARVLAADQAARQVPQAQLGEGHRAAAHRAADWVAHRAAAD